MDERLQSYLRFDYERFPWASEEEMMAKINAGEQLRYMTDMTREYYDELVWLLLSQKDSEYAGAREYEKVIGITPQFSADEYKDVPDMVNDEFKHGNRIRGILNTIGFAADHWSQDHLAGYMFRIGAEEKLADKSMRDLRRDFRVDIFYYPIVVGEPLVDCINFNIFQLVQDRGAGEQIRDTLQSSFAPWAHENAKTMREENKHIRHGDMWMARLMREHPELVQKQFDLWWPRSLATFGRPESKRNDLWRKFGLKRRTNEEVLRAFLDRTEEPVGLHPANREVGLKIPSTEETLAMWRKGEFLKSI